MCAYISLRGKKNILMALAMLPASVVASDIELDTVVITATRTSKTLTDTPIQTQVVSSADIKRKQATNLADALKDIGGLRLEPIHGKSGESVSLQGMDSDHVLIMIDGRPLTASTGSTVDARQISTFGVERIEIIKGPASALYGSSAMGGVINIITSKESGESSLGFSAQIGSWGDKNLDGEPGSYSLSATAAHGGDNWIGQYLISRDQSRGFDLTPDTYSNSGAEGEQDNFTTRFSLFTGNDWELSGDLRLYREDLRYRLSSLSPGTVEGITKKYKNGLVDRQSLTFAADGALAGGEFSGFVHVENYKEVTEQDAINSAWVDQSRTGQQQTTRADIQWDKPLDENQLLTLGLQAGSASLKQFQMLNDGTDISRINEIEGTVTQNNKDAYVQHDWTLAQGSFELISGLRYQYDNDFGSHVAPKMSFRQNLSPQWTLRGSFGTGYRVPSLKERHYVFDHSANGYMIVGNSALEPETNTSTQLSIHWAYNKHALSLGLFNNDLDNLINTELDYQTDAGIDIYSYLNIDKARLYGVEMEYQQQISPTQSIGIDITQLNTLNRATNTQLGNRPELQTSVLWKNKLSAKLNISLNWRYQYGGVSSNGDQRSLRHASILDGSAHWQLNANTQFSFNVDNVSNSYLLREDNSDLRPNEGRELRLTIDHQF